MIGHAELRGADDRVRVGSSRPGVVDGVAEVLAERYIDDAHGATPQRVDVVALEHEVRISVRAPSGAFPSTELTLPALVGTASRLPTHCRRPDRRVPDQPHTSGM